MNIDFHTNIITESHTTTRECTKKLLYIYASDNRKSFAWPRIKQASKLLSLYFLCILLGKCFKFAYEYEQTTYIAGHRPLSVELMRRLHAWYYSYERSFIIVFEMLKPMPLMLKGSRSLETFSNYQVLWALVSEQLFLNCTLIIVLKYLSCKVNIVYIAPL